GMRPDRGPLLPLQPLGIGVARRVIAPRAIRHRGGSRVDVVQQPLQKLDLILPAHRETPGLRSPQTRPDTVPYQYHRLCRFSIRYRISRSSQRKCMLRLCNSEPSGADLTFASLHAATFSCERQIQSSTSINKMASGPFTPRLATVPRRGDANVGVGPLAAAIRRNAAGARDR